MYNENFSTMKPYHHSNQRKFKSQMMLPEKLCVYCSLFSNWYISALYQHTSFESLHSFGSDRCRRLSTIRKQRIKYKTVETHICLNYVYKVVDVNIPTPLACHSVLCHSHSSQIIWQDLYTIEILALSLRCVFIVPPHKRKIVSGLVLYHIDICSPLYLEWSQAQ